MLCTVQRAQWFFQENDAVTAPADFKLGTLCEYFGISFMRSKPHDALHDTRATVELYRAILAREADQSCRERRSDLTSDSRFRGVQEAYGRRDQHFDRSQRIVPRRRGFAARADK